MRYINSFLTVTRKFPVPIGSLLYVLGSRESTKTEFDCLYGWILKKKTVTYAKISPKMVNPRDLAGEHRRRRRFT